MLIMKIHVCGTNSVFLIVCTITIIFGFDLAYGRTVTDAKSISEGVALDCSCNETRAQAPINNSPKQNANRGATQNSQSEEYFISVPCCPK